VTIATLCLRNLLITPGEVAVVSSVTLSRRNCPTDHRFPPHALQWVEREMLVAEALKPRHCEPGMPFFVRSFDAHGLVKHPTCFPKIFAFTFNLLKKPTFHAINKFTFSREKVKCKNFVSSPSINQSTK
jgi:hypothetical protein